METLTDEMRVKIPDKLSGPDQLEECIEKMLHANDLRKQMYNEPFNPISGYNAPPQPRFKFKIEEVKWFLPETMREIPIIKRLLLHGGIKRFCKAKKMEGREDYIMQRLVTLRCQHDFAFWAATCCTVKHKATGKNVKLVLNWPQRKTLKVLEEMRLNNMPIRMIILKARQWGGSTLVQMYMAWIQLMLVEGHNSAIVAHLNNASLNIRAMYKRMVEHYPPQMLGVGNETKIELAPFAGSRTDYTIKQGRNQVRDNIISVGSMQTPDSIRSSNIALVHFSEVGIWKKTESRSPEEVIQGTQSAVLNEPLTMVVMESTAKGENNLFHHEWIDAKNGDSDKVPVFVPWYEIELYRHSLGGQTAARNFVRRLILERSQTYVKDARAEPGAYLWWLWEKGASLEGIAWYIEQRKAYRDHDSMASEFPSDDKEAFATTGAAVFDRYKVDELEETCMPPKFIGEIRGDSLDGKDCTKGLKFYHEPNGPLHIWAMPDNSFETRDRYLVSVDVGGRGAKADWSVIVVFDRWNRTTGGGDEVVAEWYGHIRHDLLAWKMVQVAAFYNDALLVVESNTFETKYGGTEGEHSAYILDTIGQTYRNLYTRMTSPENIKQGGRARKWGFQTNVRTKPLIIDHLIRIVEDKLYVEREAEALSEYRTYQRDSNGAMNAAEGYHDDRLMARAIGLYISDNMPEPRKADRNFFKRGKKFFQNKKRLPNEADF